MTIDAKIKASLTRNTTSVRTNMKEMTLLVARDHTELFQPSLYRRISHLLRTRQLPNITKVARGIYTMNPVKAPAKRKTGRK